MQHIRYLCSLFAVGPLAPPCCWAYTSISVFQQATFIDAIIGLIRGCYKALDNLGTYQRWLVSPNTKAATLILVCFTALACFVEIIEYDISPGMVWFPNLLRSTSALEIGVS